MRTLVVIPTYNERDNIAPLIHAIHDLLPQVEILVVDDSSPDQTAAVVQSIQKEIPQVHLLVRKVKDGLGRAYVEGFKWALERGYEFIQEMDADFSHRPEDLVKILEAAPRGDFVMGCRYIPGGKTVNWSLGRKFISRGGSFYSSLVLGHWLSDWTGGFNGWHARVLRAIGVDTIRSNGYSFQIELKYRARRLGFKSVEVPITFEDRRVGQSKMSGNILREAIVKVWGLRRIASQLSRPQ